MLAQLVQKAIESLKVNFDGVTLYSDSMICLSWLKKSPAVLNEFVCNRVATIVELTQNYRWDYVRSENNPADVLSRGLFPEQLIDDELWWTASPEQKQPREQRDQVPVLTDDELPELRSSKNVLATTVAKSPGAESAISTACNVLGPTFGGSLKSPVRRRGILSAIRYQPTSCPGRLSLSSRSFSRKHSRRTSGTCNLETRSGTSYQV